MLLLDDGAREALGAGFYEDEEEVASSTIASKEATGGGASGGGQVQGSIYEDSEDEEGEGRQGQAQGLRERTFSAQSVDPLREEMKEYRVRYVTCMHYFISISISLCLILSKPNLI